MRRRRRIETEQEAHAHDADALLDRAGFKEPPDLRETRTGDSLAARAVYKVPISPTDKVGEDKYDADSALTVATDPHPIGDAAFDPDAPQRAGRILSPDGGSWFPIVERDGKRDVLIGDESIPLESISGILTGPDGRRRYMVADQRIEEWGFTTMQEHEAPSRAREWKFYGLADMVNMEARRFVLTHLYFRRWLRETRPRMTERNIERDGSIAEALIAESSTTLAYRGRYLTPERYELERECSGPSGDPIAMTAAAYRVAPAVVRRIRRDLGRFAKSDLYSHKAAALEATGGDLTRL